MSPTSKRLLAAGVVAAVSAATPAFAQTAVERQIEDIKRQMKEMREGYERMVDVLKKRVETLEKDAAAQKKVAAKPKPAGVSSLGTVKGKSGNEFQIGLSASTAVGGSNANNGVLANLQRGHHDPNRNGFTLQSAELFLGGSVDPYFDAQASIALNIDGEGETTVELEEVFAQTRMLPYGLQLKAGQYYTEFGRHNPMHLHQWDFVDQPVILGRLFGADGLRSQGARVSWLTPLPWFSEITVGAQNSKGETAVSFLGEEDEDVGGFTQMERGERNFADLIYSARWLNGVDVTDNVSVNAGLSVAIGPNATGSDNMTYIYGADIYAKWQPANTERGFPFFAFQGEALYREFEAGDNSDPNRMTLKDWGFYAQGLWGFTPGWVAGLRVGHANAHEGLSDKGNDVLRDGRWRVSPNITWYPSEFSKIRLQYNRDWAEHLDGTERDGTADTVWLQLEFSLGGHFAHTF